TEAVVRLSNSPFTPRLSRNPPQIIPGPCLSLVRLLGRLGGEGRNERPEVVDPEREAHRSGGGADRGGRGVTSTGVRVVIPTVLRQHTHNRDELDLSAKTVKDALQALTKSYPNLGRYLYSENGRLRNFINVYLNEEDIRSMNGEETRLKEGDTLMIVPSIAGGAMSPNGGVFLSGSEFAR